jgi:hypothetical protein
LSLAAAIVVKPTFGDDQLCCLEMGVTAVESGRDVVKGGFGLG